MVKVTGLWPCVLAALAVGCGGKAGGAGTNDGGGNDAGGNDAGGNDGGGNDGGGNDGGGNDGGGNDGGPALASCGQVQPCGGDVVGTWVFLGACENAAAISAELAARCAGASVSDYSETISGSITFKADLTMTYDVVKQTLSRVDIAPLTCASAIDCASQSASTVAGDDTSTTTCTGTTTCTCRNDVLVQNNILTGTYSVQGTTISMAIGTGTAISWYCVEGDQLHQIGLGTMTGPTGELDILSDVVSRKQ